jgi:ribosomal protein L37AE/L43A
VSVEWCEICNERPATRLLMGALACSQCSTEVAGMALQEAVERQRQVEDRAWLQEAGFGTTTMEHEERRAE